MTNEVKEWTTDNINLASYLDYKRFYCRARWEDGICYWIFEETEDLLNEVTRFLNKETQVEAQEFFGSYVNVKHKMFKSSPNDYNGKRRRGPNATESNVTAAL